MLTALSIRDVVLIDRLDLLFEPGLAAFTGETGAGKSILLDALGLALGERADAGLIRQGAAQAIVAASFAVAADHPAQALLAEQGLDTGEEIVLRRVVGRDGRSRALINEQPASVGALRRIAALLIEIQGQHSAIGLADSTLQRALLDAYGVDPALLAGTETAHAAWRAAQDAVAAAEAAIEAARRDEDFLRHAVAELAEIRPEADEEERLATERKALQEAERAAASIESALTELAPRDRRSTGPAATLRAAARQLARIAEALPDSPAAKALVEIEKAEESLAEAETLLSRAMDAADADPRGLEAIEERLFALRGLGRKHGVLVAELPALLDDMSARLARLDAGEADLSALRDAETRQRAAYVAAARALSAARDKAAASLTRAIGRELPPLKLDRARFVAERTTLPEAQWSAKGADSVRFLIATNPGDTPGALDRIASGGELARLMLALRVALAASSRIATLIFDEVDAGLGGATAAAVGERLARIATDTQVLVVTHSPQVAARAASHFAVSKAVADGRAATRVARLDDAARREEIARMLAGETVTDAAREAAVSLIGRV